MDSHDTAIEIREVKKSFGDRQALSGISFTVGRSDIFGYLGANGAGKSTTIRIVLDLLCADSGSVLILGEPAGRVETRRKIGFLLDADGLYDQLTAEENLRFYAGLYGVRPDGKRIASLLESVGLTERMKDRAGTYSKGMRRRLALARALVHDPEVLILDEPMSGIDPSGQIEMRNIIRNLVREGGKTVLFSSHDLDEVERLCNRIALIDRGEIRITGKLKELLDGGNEGRIVISTSTPVAAGILSDMEARLGIRIENGDAATLDLRLPRSVGNADVVSFLAARGVGVESVNTKHTSLEELYAGILEEREA